MDLASLVDMAEQMPQYPLHSWQPEVQGSIDICIHADGSWWHEGSPIKRHKLVQLFSRLLVYADGFYSLVTPSERLFIEVENLPFQIVQAEQNSDDVWQLTTSVGDQICLEKAEQIRVDTLILDAVPEILIRDNLWASISRQAYYDMALAVETTITEQGHIAHLRSGDSVLVFGIIE